MSENVRLTEFSVTQLKYIDWLATSKFERKPATEALLAKELGINDRTLRRWKLLPGFREATTRRARELLGDSLPEIYGALSREAVKGSYQHIKLSLEITGEYTDRQEIEHNVRVEDVRERLISKINSLITSEGEASDP